MKLLRLVFEGNNGQERIVDFSNKAQGLILPADGDNSDLKSLLSLAFFGAEEDFSSISFPSRTELNFIFEDTEYSLKRVFKNDGGKEEELAVITNTEGSVVFADSVTEVKDFVENYIAISPSVFKILFAMDKDTLFAKFSQPKAELQAFLARAVASLNMSVSLADKFNLLKKEEADLLSHIESIPYVTKKAIKEAKQKIDEHSVSAENIENELENIYQDLAKAKSYEKVSDELLLANNSLERLNSLYSDVQNMASKVSTSDRASELKPVLAEESLIRADIAKKKDELNEKLSLKETLTEKIRKGNESRAKFEKDFIASSEKKELTDKELRNLLADISVNPEVYHIDSLVNSYYKENDETLAKLVAEKEGLDKIIADLSSEIDSLEMKKNSLFTSSDFKKTVADAAIIEQNLRGLEKELYKTDEKIASLERKRVELFDKTTLQNNELRKLASESAKLQAEILGKHKDFKEAINADVLFKQTLYSKHLLVSQHEVELDAVRKKIKRLEKSNESYAFNLEENEKRKAVILSHIEKLTSKLDILNIKRNDYESYNKMSELADAVEYGSHCPICDNYVALKNNIPLKDTSSTDEQIEEVSAELTKSRKALDEVNESLGEYQSAYNVGVQYLESLKSTAAAKENIIDGILSAYGAKDITELFEILKKTIEDSNKLTLNIDAFNEIRVKLASLNAEFRALQELLAEITDLSLPAEAERRRNLIHDLNSLSEIYENMQDTLNGENGDSLILKLQVVEKEYEMISELLAHKYNDLNALKIKRSELEEDIRNHKEKLLPVKKGTKSLSYKDVIVKVVVKDISALAKQIDNLTEEAEVIKTRLAAINVIVAKAEDDLAIILNEIAVLETEIASSEKLAEMFYGRSIQEAVALGADSEEDLENLILPPSTLADYRNKVVKYDEEVIQTKENIDYLKTSLDELTPYYDALSALEEKQQELKKEERLTLVALQNAISDYEEKVKAYDELIVSNRHLGSLQIRIKGLEDLQGVFNGTEVNPDIFAQHIIQRASSKIKNWSQDRYYLTTEEEIVQLVSSKRGKAVKEDKFTREEKMLVKVGILSAFSEALASLATSKMIPAIEISEEETDKNSLSVVLEAAREKDLLVLTHDSAAIVRTLSRI